MVSYPHVFAGVKAHAHPLDPYHDHLGDPALLLPWHDRCHHGSWYTDIYTHRYNDRYEYAHTDIHCYCDIDHDPYTHGDHHPDSHSDLHLHTHSDLHLDPHRHLDSHHCRYLRTHRKSTSSPYPDGHSCFASALNQFSGKGQSKNHHA